MNQYITNNTEMPNYMQFPKFLLDMEINETAKLLYMVLLDRARLSMINQGWQDAYGRVFMVYPIEDLAMKLHKCPMTIKTALTALQNEGLIVRKRQGVGRANLIYVKLPNVVSLRLTKITNLGALKIVLGVKHFIYYLLFVLGFAFFTGILVNLAV